MALATFGAGCFWGVEYFFRQVNGVISATSGYMGGDETLIRYEEVKSGTTGHAEVVQVEYDESVVSYNDLLAVFWSNHNPTTLNQQGEDIGHQYRSVVFFHSEYQKELAQQSKAELIECGKWGNRIVVTEILVAQEFFAAEDFHQNYIEKNGLPSCHISF
ncbi:peptide-methionine (S)-S-oxide reductase [Parashewanella spongiae]|uniref:Peptide methionine sulfoxide reductase MsrA n=1 Tax=Parashewanella spongiae TaxID=342950 RepID=A0A3A6TX31_9GAMM|nr:peptide-methionine (S)-S-oxide reductase MsrA [Parashewanella spongiae]MCL1078218.1 peptide-methionine (S)-S-oxide reductase MsrA [Parashewanella spongiae]RJY16286.1 peptide-methionine (S)-S-oxide reductase [Parashewanella spongiae]